MKRLISLILSVVLLVGLVTVGTVPVSAESAFEPSEDMIALLKELEGFDKYPRWDYQQWTVGYGSACPSEDLERYRKNGITVEEAEALLKSHMAGFVKSVNSLNDKYEMNLTQNQFDAILLFTYNMGHAWMFRDTNIRAALVNGAVGNDLMYAMGQWCHAGGDILLPLVKRRLMEYNVYVNGEYSRTLPENYCYVIYEMNGGTGLSDVQCYDSNLTDTIRVTPTKEGYTFDGWYTANSGGEKVTVLDASVRNMTLYARWITGTETPPQDPSEGQDPEQPSTMEPVTVTVTANDVNIRKGPGTSYGIVDRVDKGVQMTITEVQTGSGYTWGKFDGGWIALMYTNYDEVINQQPEETDPPATEPPVTEPPVTEPPVTEPPVTEPPVTEPPVTEPPVTEPPETEPPVTEPPETEPPVTEPPETEPPVTEPPETEPPVTEPVEPEPPVEKPVETAVMGTVTGNKLCIRSGAGTSYKVMGYHNKGDRVKILEQKTVGSMTWGKTEKGWISLKYVKLDTPEQAPEQTSVKGTVTGNKLCVRSGAGTSYKVQSYLYKGDRVEILEQKTVGSMTWGKTEKGWISMTYVKLDQAATQTPETPETPPETTPPVTDTEPDPAPSKTIGTVTAKCLCIRSSAGTSSKVVGYLYKNDQVEILETKTVNGMTWGRVSKGWISLSYVNLKSTEEQVQTVIKTVNTACLRVRSQASTSSKVVGYLYKGAKAEILETKTIGGTTWGRTEKGWISMEYLK